MRIERDERRARLVSRHLLGGTGDNPLHVTESVAAVHSSDPVTPYLSMRARIPGFEAADLDRALFETRSVWRMHAMRRTLFLVPVAGAGVFQAGATRAIADREWARLVGWLAADVGDSRSRSLLEALSDAVLETLGDGELRTAEMSAAIPDLQRRLAVGSGKWTSTVPLSSRLLYLMAMDGLVVRTRPAGSWRSSQYHWARADRWFPSPPEQLDPEKGQTRLLDRYLEAHGPATLTDITWWTGWTRGVSRAALDRLGARPAALADDEGWVAPGYEVPSRQTGAVALLPGLDSTPMGWKQRDWYLAPGLVGEVFDRNGNVGPTVWSDGSVIGGWAQDGEGVIRHRLLVPIDSEVADRVELECRRLEAWLGEIRLTPRFRTPLERELAG